jgi:hypothetical protein
LFERDQDSISFDLDFGNQTIQVSFVKLANVLKDRCKTHRAVGSRFKPGRSSLAVDRAQQSIDLARLAAPRHLKGGFVCVGRRLPKEPERASALSVQKAPDTVGKLSSLSQA